MLRLVIVFNIFGCYVAACHVVYLTYLDVMWTLACHVHVVYLTYLDVMLLVMLYICVASHVVYLT